MNLNSSCRSLYGFLDNFTRRLHDYICPITMFDVIIPLASVFLEGLQEFLQQSKYQNSKFFQIGMGRTARISKSPYAAANRTSRSRSTHNSPSGKTVIYQRTGGGNVLSVQQNQQQSAGDNQQPSGAGCS